MNTIAIAAKAIYNSSRYMDPLPMDVAERYARAALEAAFGPQFEGTVCFDSEDWDWWLKLAPEVKGRAVAAFRQAVDAELFTGRPAFFTPASAQITIVGNTPTTGGTINSDYQYSDAELRLRAECEKGYSVGPSANGPYAVTGETFTELHSPDMAAGNDQAAFEAALTAFKHYAEGQPGTIYWRVYPEISGGKFYMRLLISDKPAIKKADAA